MTRIDPRNQRDEHDPWARIARNVHPSDDLMEKTASAMHAAAETRPERRMAPASAATARRQPSVSRRRFAALGGACAVTAAIAVAAPLALRKAPSDNAPTFSTPVEAPVFGLKIAQAAEPGTTVEIAAVDGNPLPLTHDGGFRYLCLRLNLSCVGDNVDTLTFSLLDVPTATYYGTRPFDPPETVEPLVSFTEDLLDASDSEATQALSSYEEHIAWGDETFSVDLLENPDWDGTRQTPYGTTVVMVGAQSPEEEFWKLDPVLAAKRAWVVANCSTREEVPQSTVDELLGAYIEVYAGVSATPEDALQWSRSCYVAGMSLTAQQLAQATLHVEAGFGDGSTAVKRYRIGTVENFSEAIGARYDALYDLRSAEPDYGWDIAPFYSFLNEQHELNEDPRLAVPLFTITDVTDAA